MFQAKHPEIGEAEEFTLVAKDGTTNLDGLAHGTRLGLWTGTIPAVGAIVCVLYSGFVLVYRGVQLRSATRVRFLCTMGHPLAELFVLG